MTKTLDILEGRRVSDGQPALVYSFRDTEINMEGAGTGATGLILEDIQQKLNEGYVLRRIDVPNVYLSERLKRELGVN